MSDKVKLIINDIKYEINKDILLGSDIKGLANIPIEERLVLNIKNQPDKEILNNGSYNVKAGMNFYSESFNTDVEIIVDGKEYCISKQFITGKEIKEVVGLSSTDYKLIQEVKNGADRIIEDNIEYEIEKGDRFFAMPTGISNGGM